MSKKIAIVYHSSYGHTEKVAHAIAEGIKGSEIIPNLINIENITDKNWSEMDEANAIIFGSPTYMGGVSGKFKTFIDNTSKQWSTRRWKDKLAAGFTNSGSYNGDKLAALQQLMTSAMQHGMIWIGQSEMHPLKNSSHGPGANDINRLGSFTGLMTQAGNDSPEITPPSGDIETAKMFGRRIAEIAKRFN